MSKLVVIKLDKGSLNDGFTLVTAQYWETSSSRPTQFTASLPPAPEIGEIYKRFQLMYESLHERMVKRSMIEIDSTGLNNVSEVDFGEVQQQLHSALNDWLNCNSFRPIDQQLRARLALDDELQVIFETSNYLLRQLPWHLWNFFEDYRYAEVGLSFPKYEQVKPFIKKHNINQVRILAVLGNSAGIDVQEDKKILEGLPSSSTVFLVEPSRQELDKHLWDKRGWDILFFAGHSESQNNKGKIHINQNSTLTIAELRNALKFAIAHGLKLAIFNSCDGLGLTQQLADLQIPQTIVMRHNIPDVVAQEFLKYFLTSFVYTPFYVAMRYARERLQGLEDNYPGVSWLPVVCQNPAEEPVTWLSLCGQPNTISLPPFPNQKFQIIFLASIVITSLLMGIRSLSILQYWELSVFDTMMRMRPAEKPDPRIVVVTVTEADIQAQEQRQKSSISDETLQKLLQKLQLYKPAVIGLDVYRDFPVDKKYPDLKTQLQKNDNLIAVCQAASSKIQSKGVSRPPEVSEERTAFSDVSIDDYSIIRRHLLSMNPDPDSLCKSSYSFSLRVAIQYLGTKGILSDITEENLIKLGDVVLNPIDVPTGGYQKFSSGGYQILLNYRSSKDVSKKVTLGQVLSGEFNSTLFKDKIVLIGVDADSVKDYFLTPYSVANPVRQEVPGVVIHAHMVSQIISAVLNKRPLLFALPVWGEVIVVGGCSILGCILALYAKSRLQFIIFIGTVLIALYITCLILLIRGCWAPFLPSSLAFVSSAIAVKVCKNQQQDCQFILETKHV
ncbi:MAG: CHASE2 domain-containing protein [Calothrix sp. FI2-JRJ7]|jgi:CHASE2 domain-containing sensor protein|nr:CHASE2 domain-containing protein [Calothrix sp. FI2-JRJ7]